MTKGWATPNYTQTTKILKNLQGVVTPIGPILTSATAVKIRSSGQGQILDPLVNDQDGFGLVNYQGLTHRSILVRRSTVNAVKSRRSNGQAAFWAVKNLDRGRSCEYRTYWSDHPLT